MTDPRVRPDLRSPAPRDRTDNTLAYIDQASFLALRALGRGPLIQFTWIYERGVDIDGLRRFSTHLGFGLLGRRIERSVLPFGRDRWVASSGPENVEIAARDRPRDEVWAWADERVRVPIDPAGGPSWHLGLQPLTGGGAAVTLVVSHSVGDVKAINIAIEDAVRGLRRDLGYPPPGSRTRGQAFRRDARQTVASVPDVAKAVAAAVRVARADGQGVSMSLKTGSRRRPRERGAQVVVPTVAAFFDVDHWDTRARELAGTSNSLFAGVGARLGQILGRVDDDGLVRLSLPVSERKANDTRANALTAVSLTADPSKVTTDLSEIRKDVKEALVELDQNPNEMLGSLALGPLTPRLLVRRLEGLVQQVGSPIGCSNVGVLDPLINRPDGSDADRLAIRMLEPRVTTDVLDRMGGLLYLLTARMHDRVFVTVSSWVVDGTNTKDSLRDSLRLTLDDMQLVGGIE